MAFHPVKIESIQRHNERLIFLTVEKPAGFRYKPGQFVRLGIALKDNPASEEDFLVRPYSLASHPDEPVLSFYIARVLDGALTPKLFEKAPGETLYVDDTAYGMMLPERLQEGGTLMCFASGSGLSAFLSVVKDNPWKRFDNVVIVHCARMAADISLTPLFMQAVKAQHREVNFRFIAATTREPDPAKQGEITKRVPDAIREGDFTAMGFDFSPKWIRAMICGNPGFVDAVKAALKEKGFSAARGAKPGTYVAENFW